MRDALTSLPQVPVISEESQAEALHAMGSFYVRQGFPKQGLALLLAAHKFAVPSMELNRAIAHAYVLAGVPQMALAMLDALSRDVGERQDGTSGKSLTCTCAACNG